MLSPRLPALRQAREALTASRFGLAAVEIPPELSEAYTNERLFISSPAGAPKPKLLDQVRQAIRTRHYSYSTEKTYVGWMTVLTAHQMVDGGVRTITPLIEFLTKGSPEVDQVFVISTSLYPPSSQVHAEPFQSAITILKRTLDLLQDEIYGNDFDQGFALNLQRRLQEQFLGYVETVQEWRDELRRVLRSPTTSGLIGNLSNLPGSSLQTMPISEALPARWTFRVPPSKSSWWRVANEPGTGWLRAIPGGSRDIPGFLVRVR